MSARLPASLIQKMSLPVIAAPMFLVTGPELVLACCRAGVIGAFPAPNARSIAILDEWMATISGRLAGLEADNPGEKIAPWAANIIVHRTYSRMQAELDLVVKYRAPVVITALGSPAAVVEAVHSYGGLVLADVNSISFAAKAAKTGIDGLVLVSAGAGGHTGLVSGFAFVEAVRQFWDGIIVLGGAIASGRAIKAAQVLGADLVYMGTPFIATTESMVGDEYRQMLVAAGAEDILCTPAFTGVNANMLKPSIRRMGLDPDNLQPKKSIDFDDPQANTKAWKNIWSAGHGVGSVTKIQPAADLIAQLRTEYKAAGVEGWGSRKGRTED